MEVRKIASIQDGVLKPEKVISKMKIISVKLEELNLLIEKNKHTYIKVKLIHWTLHLFQFSGDY